MTDEPAPERERAPYSLFGTGQKEDVSPATQKEAPTQASRAPEEPNPRGYREYVATDAASMSTMLDDLLRDSNIQGNDSDGYRYGK